MKRKFQKGDSFIIIGHVTGLVKPGYFVRIKGYPEHRLFFSSRTLAKYAKKLTTDAIILEAIKP